MTCKCSRQSDLRKCHMNFLTRLSDRYTGDFVISEISRQNSTAHNISNDQIFFKFSYINDTIDGRMKYIIKTVHQKILITWRGHNIWAFLAEKTISNCPRDCGTEEFQSRYDVYEYTCNSTNNYIRSTKRCNNTSDLQQAKNQAASLSTDVTAVNLKTVLKSSTTGVMLWTRSFKRLVNPPIETNALLNWLGKLNNISVP